MNKTAPSKQGHIILTFFAIRCDRAAATCHAASNARDGEKAAAELHQAVRDLCFAFSEVARNTIGESKK